MRAGISEYRSIGVLAEYRRSIGGVSAEYRRIGVSEYRRSIRAAHTAQLEAIRGKYPSSDVGCWKKLTRYQLAQCEGYAVTIIGVFLRTITFFQMHLRDLPNDAKCTCAMMWHSCRSLRCHVPTRAMYRRARPGPAGAAERPPGRALEPRRRRLESGLVAS